MLYRMRHVLCGLIVGLLLSVQPPVYAQSEDETTIKSIFDERLTSGEMYELLRELCKDIGPRLSGSEGAAKAVDWSKQVMEGYGFDRVFLQEVMVPHWERGEKEQVQIVNVPEGMIELRALAIGGSVGTPAEGITAEVVIVLSLIHISEPTRPY